MPEEGPVPAEIDLPERDLVAVGNVRTPLAVSQYSTRGGLRLPIPARRIQLGLSCGAQLAGARLLQAWPAQVAGGSQPLMNRRDLNRRLEPNRKFVEVTDARGDRLPVVGRDFDAEGDRGGGLLLVAALADRWGTAPYPPSAKTVWAECGTERACSSLG